MSALFRPCARVFRFPVARCAQLQFRALSCPIEEEFGGSQKYAVRVWRRDTNAHGDTVLKLQSSHGSHEDDLAVGLSDTRYEEDIRRTSVDTPHGVTHTVVKPRDPIVGLVAKAQSGPNIPSFHDVLFSN